MRLVELAHSKVKNILQPGDFCIDATAGNGNDTLFLAKNIAPDGMVYAIDIQKTALDATVVRLKKHGFLNLLKICHGSHEKMGDFLNNQHKGKVATVMFNLGYLPCSNHNIITKPETSIEAISEAYKIIRPGGLLTILCYRGHHGGKEETNAVLKLCKKNKWGIERIEKRENPDSPVLIIIQKIRKD